MRRLQLILPLFALCLLHLFLFAFCETPETTPVITDERHVWHVILSPYFLLLLGGMTLPVSLIAALKQKKEGFIKAGQVWAVMLYCALVALLLNAYAFSSIEQLPINTFIVAGCLCLGLALLGRWSLLCWFPAIFLSLVAYVAHYMNISLTYGNLLELFGASWQDAKDYVTPLNCGLLVLSLVVSACCMWPMIKCLRGVSRLSLAALGLLCTTLSVGLLQASSARIQMGQVALWPIGNGLSVSYHSARALKLMQGIKEMTRFLPPRGEIEVSPNPDMQHDDGVVCILHIGESMRADHLSINGYGRDTTPKLAALDGLISYSNCIAAAPMTDRAMMTILTNARRDYLTEQRKEYLASSPPLPDFFVQSGQFHVASFWGPGSLKGKGAPLFVEEVKFFTRSIEDTVEIAGLPLDQLSPIKTYLDEHAEENLFVLLNNRGSHCPFNEYNTENAHFPVSQPITFSLSPQSNPQDATDVLNAYDNTAYELDQYIDELIRHLQGKPFLYIYISDHGDYVGEEGYWYRIFTPDNLFFRLPACRVPFLIYASPELLAQKTEYREKLERLRAHREMTVGQEHIFHTILGFFGLQTPFYTPDLDLCTEQVQPYDGPQPGKED